MVIILCRRQIISKVVAVTKMEMLTQSGCSKIRDIFSKIFPPVSNINKIIAELTNTNKLKVKIFKKQAFI